VLVGATPQVLAQAAMTRQFDIKTEIEFKDDLDKKPDENDLFTTSIVNLVRELNRFSEKKQFDWNGNTEYQIESLAICGSDNSPSFLGTNSGNHKIDRALKKTGIEIARKFFAKKSAAGLGDFYSHNVEYKFVLNNKSLTINAKIGDSSNYDKNVQPFVNELNNYLARTISNHKQPKQKTVAENTSVTFENNQVFIVIRLPRASIDELLAENAR
jgi:hypothetical protein